MQELERIANLRINGFTNKDVSIDSIEITEIATSDILKFTVGMFEQLKCTPNLVVLNGKDHQEVEVIEAEVIEVVEEAVVPIEEEVVEEVPIEVEVPIEEEVVEEEVVEEEAVEVPIEISSVVLESPSSELVAGDEDRFPTLETFERHSATTSSVIDILDNPITIPSDLSDFESMIPKQKKGRPAKGAIKDELKNPRKNLMFYDLEDYDLVTLYQKGLKESVDSSKIKELMDELLHRNWNYIIYYARKVHNLNQTVAEYEDFIGFAVEAAIASFSTYKYSIALNTSAKFSTYLITCVNRYLSKCANEQGRLKIKGHFRKWKSYLTGSYDSDPLKKAAFEAQHNITEEKANKMRVKHPQLVQPCSVGSELIQENDGENAYDAISEYKDPNALPNEEKYVILDSLERLKPLYSDFQLHICKLQYDEQMTLKEMARVLGKTPEEIRREHRKIMEIGREFFEIEKAKI